MRSICAMTMIVVLGLAALCGPAHADSGYGDSNVFSITCAGQGELSGQVLDFRTGQPIAEATVTLTGYPPVQTGPAGEFRFTGVEAGELTVHVEAGGYYELSETVTIREDSGTSCILLMTPDTGFGVVEVRGYYCGPGKHTYYLNGISVGETFTATVEWENYTPGYVRWITPLYTYHDDCPGTTVSRSFNMGSEFGEGGTLTVVAYTGSGEASEPYPVNLKVVPLPDGIPAFAVFHDIFTNTLKYHGTYSVDFAAEEGVEAGVIPADIPGFGERAFSFASKGELELEVTGDGEASAKVTVSQASVPTKIAGVEFTPELGGSVLWHYAKSRGWMPGGAIHVGGTFEYDTPPTYVIFLVGPIPVPAYWRLGFELELSAQLAFQSWAGPAEPLMNGSIEVDPYAEVMLGVGMADVLAAEGYLGGGARMILQYPEEPPLDALQIYLSGGVRIVIFIFEFDCPILEYTWDLFGGKGGRWICRQGPVFVRILSRDYLFTPAGYALFVANNQTLRTAGRGNTIETPIQLNVFGQSTPDLAAAGDDLLMVWAFDDPARTPTNRSEIVFSAYDSGSGLWSAPGPVADDGTADFHPQVSTFPDGDSIVAFENVKEVLQEPEDPNDPDQVLAKLEEMKSKTDIAVSTYDTQTGQWAAQTMITDNAVLDRSPRLATAAGGKAMLTWVSNADNNAIGSTTEPNTLHYCTYDSIDWSAPQTIATNLPGIVKTAMAYNGLDSILLFTVDMDDNGETANDRELYAVWTTEGSWGTVTRLTSDTVEDANPQVAYTYTGTPLITWYSGGNIEMTTNPLLSDRTVVVAGDGESSGAADFRMSCGASGQISLVWQDTSQDRVDMWYATYDAVMQAWSMKQRLTSDGSMEYAMAADFTACGDMVVAYDKAQVIYESRTVYVNGQPVNVDNVPVADQVDLYCLWHITSGDLAVNAEDVDISPPNPVAGEIVTITAQVKNLGDVAATDIDVAFYDGAPGGAGELIGTATIAGPLVGGNEATASVQWEAPPSVLSHDLYVVVDPDLMQDDYNRSNNTAILAGVMKPDAVVESILVQEAGPDLLITVRLANAGALAITEAQVTLRNNGLFGPGITNLTSSEIVPGAFQDLTYRWESPTPAIVPTFDKAMPGRFNSTNTPAPRQQQLLPPSEDVWMLYVVADETDAIDEFDESNNVKSAVIPQKSSGGRRQINKNP